MAAIAFSSRATAQVTTRASVDSQGGQSNGRSWEQAVSSAGQFVAFSSAARNLIAGDTNGDDDVFVRDRLQGLTSRVSVSSSGSQGNARSSAPSISDDGRYVAFHSDADNLVALDSNRSTDVFVHDRLTAHTICASVNAVGMPGNHLSIRPTLSADGSCLVFLSHATDLVPGDTNGMMDVFVRNLVTGQTTRVSLSSSGVQANGSSAFAAISGNGRRVAFSSDATNLVPGHTNGRYDIFVHDRLTGQTSLCSVSNAQVQANGPSDEPFISASGRFVFYRSYANNLVANDTNSEEDVFLRDLQTGRTERLSVSSAGVQAAGGSGSGTLSADGRYAAFASWAGNLVAGDTNGVTDCFVHDRITGQTTRVSVDAAGLQCNGTNYDPVISSDGAWVAYASLSDNLVPQDTNAAMDVFLHDRGFVDPRLTRAGLCPGGVTLRVTGATRGARVAFACGTAGPFVRSVAPCAGLALDIARPAITAVVLVDDFGAAGFTVRNSPQLCGRSVQAVDLASCTPTNVIVL